MPTNWRTKMQRANPRKKQTTGAHLRIHIKSGETYKE